MLIEISGMQKAGKTTLIEGLTFEYNHYKFPMGTVCKYFEIQPTWEMQIAKDISTMELYDQLVLVSDICDTPTISDRGPLSTIFYSLLFKRASDEQIERFVKFLSGYRFWRPVWVDSINQPVMNREKNDNFDKLQDGLDDNEVKLAKQKMFGLLDKYHKPYKIIINDFNNTVEENQQKFDQELIKIVRDDSEY